MKKFLERIWWRNIWTRGAFPLIPLAIGLMIVNLLGNNPVATNIGMAFIIMAIGAFVWGLWYSIEEGRKKVDEICDEREKREKQGKPK